MRQSFKYWAFISYSHKDKTVADWLHKSLETYRVPKQLVGQTSRNGVVPKRVFPIFRDREELPTSANLGENIEQALSESHYLIVICSPNSASSMWVNEEIKSFKRLGGADRILCLIVDGEPNATDKAGESLLECFPPGIRFELGEDLELSEQRAEPIAADARAQGDGKTNAKLKLIAGLLGVDFDQLKQRDKKRARNKKALIFSALVTTILIVLATVFFIEQQQSKRDFEHATNALRVASIELEEGRLTAAALLSDYSTKQIKALALGRFTNWAERLLDVPMSYQAEAHRNLLVSSQSLLSKAVNQHPIELPWREEFTGLILESGHQASQQVTQTKESALLNELGIDIARISQFRLLENQDRLLLVSTSNSLAVWQISSKQQLIDVPLAPDFGTVKTIATDTSGRYALLLSDQSNHLLFDVVELEDLSFPSLGAVDAAVFRPGSRHLALSSQNGLQLIDVQDGTIIADLTRSGGYGALYFDASGSRLLVASEGEQKAFQFEATTTPRRLEGNISSLRSLEFSLGGERLIGLLEPATHGRDRRARINIWHGKTGKIENTVVSNYSYPKNVTLSPKADFIAALSDEELELWSVESGAKLSMLEGVAPSQYIFHPAGRTLVSWGAGENVNVWDLQRDRLAYSIKDEGQEVKTVQVSKDGELLALGLKSGIVRLIAAHDGKTVGEFNICENYPIISVDLTNGGGAIIARCGDKTSRAYAVENKAGKIFTKHQYELGVVKYSPNDEYIVTTDYPDFSSTTRKLEIQIFDGNNYQRVNVLDDHWHFTSPEVYFAKSGSHLVTYTDTTRIFNLEGGELFSVFDDSSVAIDYSGQQVAVKENGYFVIKDWRLEGPPLDEFLSEAIPTQLDEDTLQYYFPKTPKLLGY